MSDLRDRIAAALDKALPESALDVGFYQRLGVTPLVDIEAYDLNLELLADAVIAELDLENRIASAVQGYAQSEMVGIDYHDPMHRETAYEAMKKLNRYAVGIADYAMKYRRPDGTA